MKDHAETPRTEEGAYKKEIQKSRLTGKFYQAGQKQRSIHSIAGSLVTMLSILITLRKSLITHHHFLAKEQMGTAGCSSFVSNTIV